MGKQGVLCLLCGWMLVACAAPKLPDGGAQLGQDDLGAFMEIAPGLRPCTAAVVSARLGIQLEVESESRFWTYYGATASGSIEQYDLRVPKTGAMSSGGERSPQLVAVLADGAVLYEDALERWGPPVPDTFNVLPAGGPTAFREAFALGRNEVLVGAGLGKPRSVTDIIVNCR